MVKWILSESAEPKPLTPTPSGHARPAAAPARCLTCRRPATPQLGSHAPLEAGAPPPPAGEVGEAPCTTSGKGGWGGRGGPMRRRRPGRSSCCTAFDQVGRAACASPEAESRRHRWRPPYHATGGQGCPSPAHHRPRRQAGLPPLERREGGIEEGGVNDGGVGGDKLD